MPDFRYSCPIMSRPFLSLIAGFVVIAVLLVLQATRSSASMVLTPAQLLEKAHAGDLKRVRVGGRVADSEEIHYSVQPKIVLEFSIQDRDAPEKRLPVRFEGLKPDMFDPGRDVLIDGDYVSGRLIAYRLLTQCPSKYEPPAPGQQKSVTEGAK